MDISDEEQGHNDNDPTSHAKAGIADSSDTYQLSILTQSKGRCDEDLLYNLASQCESKFDEAVDVCTAKASLPKLVKIFAEYQQRFTVWAAYLGVFARKGQSLDRRLKKHPDLIDLVARLLSILIRRLIQLIQDNTWDDIEHLKAIDDSITRLVRLGVTIRQSSRSKIANNNENAAMASFSSLCTKALDLLYPNAHESLKEHLLATMMKRCSRLIDNNKRQLNLTTRRDAVPNRITPVITQRKNKGLLLQAATINNMMKSTAIGDYSAAIKLGESEMSSIDRERLNMKLKLMDRQLGTSYKTKSVQVNQDIYPLIPISGDDDNIFACKWCGEALDKSVMTPSAWRRHIDRDLRPYICLEDSCHSGRPFFSTLDEWLQHMKSHRPQWYRENFLVSKWICALCNASEQVFTDSNALYLHLQDSHSDMFHTSQMLLISRQSKTERSRPWNECLLCTFTVDDSGNVSESVTGLSLGKRPREDEQQPQTIKIPRRGGRDDKSPGPSHRNTDTTISSSSETQFPPVDKAKIMGRHIASHLQVLMLLTLRFTTLQEMEVKDDTGSDIDSQSVDFDDDEDLELSEIHSEESISAVSVESDSELEQSMDIDDDNGDHQLDDQISIPDAMVDFSDVVRKYDNLKLEDDTLLAEIVQSGAFQLWDKPQSPKSSRLENDDDDGNDDETDEPNGDALIENFTADLEGFKKHILMLNPMLDARPGQYLVDRLATQQLSRYNRLLNKHKERLDLGTNNSNVVAIPLVETPEMVIIDNMDIPQSILRRWNYHLPRAIKMKKWRDVCWWLSNDKHASPTIKIEFENIMQMEFQILKEQQEKQIQQPDSFTELDEDENLHNLSFKGSLDYGSFPKDIPLPPKRSLPAEFECPVCFQTRHFRIFFEYTLHVYEDIEPFTCTWPDCRGNRAFSNQADWLRHENEGHRHLECWKCSIEDCGHICHRRDNILQHIVREHRLPEQKAKTMAQIGRAGASDPTWQKVEECHRKAKTLPKDEPCRFCGRIFGEWKKLTDHLAEHMKQISLPILRLVSLKAKELKANADSLEGIKILYDTPNAVMDICFIHGLTGDRESTWTADGQQETWPKALLGPALKARIFTFGFDIYDTTTTIDSSNRIRGHGNRLLHELTHMRGESSTISRDLVIVAHSIGGLICKQSMLLSDNHSSNYLRALSKSLRGVIFMGCPNQGSWMTHWATISASALGFLESTNTSLLDVFNVGKEPVEEIQDKFLVLVHDRTRKSMIINITCYFEELPTNEAGLVVPKSSATLSGYDYYGINATHADMVKFVSTQDTGYQLVASQLQQWQRGIEASGDRYEYECDATGKDYNYSGLMF